MTKALVSDFHASSECVRTSPWNKQVLRTSWQVCIENSKDVARTVETLTMVNLSILCSPTLYRRRATTMLNEYQAVYLIRLSRKALSLIDEQHVEAQPVKLVRAHPEFCFHFTIRGLTLVGVITHVFVTAEAKGDGMYLRNK
jgi:hypothetical protein